VPRRRSFQIRRARDTDREAIWKVHTESIRALCAGWYGDAEIDVWIARLTPEVYRGAILNRVMLVAEDADDVVGFGQLDVERREVEAVYVRPEGVRRGIGAAILRRLEELARTQGIGRLHLCASLNAQGFYAAHGYRPMQKEQHRLTDGVALDCIRMEKTLFA
jgi:GNAT superfamily N-acetyltransferase